jgi:site-specific DNA recombinase
VQPSVSSPKPVRCAIYTRKSTDDGLEQDFNSLDAQRECAEAYILSQRHEQWTVVPERYDDGGFTGANIDRPALQKLLSDAQAGRIDCVVVYKVDRLSRSLLDFARIMEVFDKRNVSFVSVTQQLNTTSPMGRLTLNVLLSFAQFEREIISERTTGNASQVNSRLSWTAKFGTRQTRSWKAASEESPVLETNSVRCSKGASSVRYAAGR